MYFFVPLNEEENVEIQAEVLMHVQNRANAVCATHPSNLATQPTQLRFQRQSSTGDVHSRFIDRELEEPLFKCCVKRGFFRESRILHEIHPDGTPVPVLKFRERGLRVSPYFSVRHVADHGRYAFVCTMVKGWTTLKLTATFYDVLNFEFRQVVVKGRLWGFNNEYTIYLGQPKEGGKIIGRITPRHVGKPPVSDNGEVFWDRFLLHVSPGVDVALLATLVLIVDDYTS